MTSSAATVVNAVYIASHGYQLQNARYPSCVPSDSQDFTRVARLFSLGWPFGQSQGNEDSHWPCSDTLFHHRGCMPERSFWQGELGGKATAHNSTEGSNIPLHWSWPAKKDNMPFKVGGVVGSLPQFYRNIGRRANHYCLPFSGHNSQARKHLASSVLSWKSSTCHMTLLYYLVHVHHACRSRRKMALDSSRGMFWAPSWMRSDVFGVVSRWSWWRMFKPNCLATWWKQWATSISWNTGRICVFCFVCSYVRPAMPSTISFLEDCLQQLQNNCFKYREALLMMALSWISRAHSIAARACHRKQDRFSWSAARSDLLKP